jgi:hypothetical protein
MSKSISALLGDILSSPAPVILWDTCALLDIMRAVYRTEVDNRSVDRAQRILSLLSTGPRKVWSVASEIVEREFQSHELVVQLELYTLLDALDVCATDLSKTGRYTASYSPTSALALTLHGLSADLISNSEILSVDAVCDRRAGYRMAAVVPPCRGRGSNNSADCRIIEHYLEIARKLSAASFPFRVLFVSSNKRDYGEPSNVKYILGAEFSAVKLDYVKDAHAAAELLGI